MEYILPQCFGHGPVTLIGVHNSGENILFAANDLYSSFVSVLIKSLGKLIPTMGYRSRRSLHQKSVPHKRFGV